MKIQKGAIMRNIDEKNLQVYKDKGYKVVEEPAAPAPEPAAEPDTGKKAAK